MRNMQTGKVSSEGLNLRERADSKSPIVDQLSRGDELDVFETVMVGDDKWVRVMARRRGSIGWANAKYVEATSWVGMIIAVVIAAATAVGGYVSSYWWW